MVRKIAIGAALFAAWIVSVGFTAGMMNSLNAKGRASSSVWVGHPDAARIQQPVVLTKHQLFSEDHIADIVAIEQVWAAYGFYNDSHNGPGIASLFTPDAVVHFVWDNLVRGGKVMNNLGAFVPHFGVVAPGDALANMMTPEGAKGSGCVLHGRAQIEQYYGTNRLPVLPWPGHSHHETTAMMVKVADDGQTAILSAPYVIAAVDARGHGRIATGGYRPFFKKTSEGWEVAELYAVDDHPVVTPGCNLNGPFPRK